MFVYLAVLFFVLTPGVLLSLPPKGSKFVVALTHAAVFGVVYYFTSPIVLNLFTPVPSMTMAAPPLK